MPTLSPPLCGRSVLFSSGSLPVVSTGAYLAAPGILTELEEIEYDLIYPEPVSMGTISAGM